LITDASVTNSHQTLQRLNQLTLVMTLIIGQLLMVLVHA
jgi:hypothetical protein